MGSFNFSCKIEEKRNFNWFGEKTEYFSKNRAEQREREMEDFKTWVVFFSSCKIMGSFHFPCKIAEQRNFIWFGEKQSISPKTEQNREREMEDFEAWVIFVLHVN